MFKNMRYEQNYNNSMKEHFLPILHNIWDAVVNAPLWYNILVIIGMFFSNLWMDLYVVVMGILVLTIMDSHLAIRVAVKNGGKYESKKLKNGLLQKMKLYPAICILTITLDKVFLGIYDYENHYLTYVTLASVCFYEAGSNVEKLAKLYPENKIVRKLAKKLNLIEKDFDEKTKL